MRETTAAATARRGEAAVCLAAVALAVQPAAWLFGTWRDPAYDSMGAAVFLLVAGLLGASVGSGPAREDPGGRTLALRLITLTALFRLAGRLLAVNVLGAFALVVDVYAIARLLRTGGRPRAVAPFGLAAAFAFALPIERMVQRLVGFPLQLTSAAGASVLLRLVSHDVQRLGTRLVLAGHDVLVDLPCSGARGLVLLLFLFTLLGAFARPSPRRLVAGLALCLAAALFGNTLRVAVLSAGIAWPRLFLGADVMASPWHDAVGLVALAVAAWPSVLWARRTLPRTPPVCNIVASRSLPPRLRARAAALVAAALVAGFAPGHPVDVSAARRPPELPLQLDGRTAVPQPLSPREQAYFTRFGGGAVKARYGAETLLVVRTTSPLRHLHAPDECLAGSGHRVRRAGVDFDGLPSAVYRSEAPDGRVWRVAVTFVSEEGEIATSVAEVVWQWLRRPRVGWTELQRLSDWDLPAAERSRFDATLVRAFDISLPAAVFIPRKEVP